MFAPTFDSFKRAVESKNPAMTVKKLCTTFTNTEDFAAYYAVYESGANEKLHVTFEADAPSVATFYIVTVDTEPSKKEGNMTEQIEQTAEVPDAYKILSKLEGKASPEANYHQWLVALPSDHIFEELPQIVDGKAKPPRMGATDHVIVTLKRKVLDENNVFLQTVVSASDGDGTFYNAPLYVAPGWLVDPLAEQIDMTMVMFALGEV